MSTRRGAYAAVDIGSNSVRLLIVDQALGDVHRESNVTGLARGVDGGGELSWQAVDETLSVLRRYADLIHGGGIDVVAAVATSASRDASNGAEVMDRFAGVLGTEPRIIDGRTEADLAFTGAVSHLPGSHMRVVIDIGGGSTEVIFGTSDVEWAHSYDIGSVRLTDRHLAEQPSTPEAVSRAEDDARRVLSSPAAPPASDAEVVGVAGSFSNLAAIALGMPDHDASAVHGATLTRGQVSALIDRFIPLPVDELRLIPAMHPKRARVILGGAIVARATMDAVGAHRLTVSAHGLLDGLVRRLADEDEAVRRA